jgi:hypothetical protein
LLVIPAHAGSTLVIPAKAGIQLFVVDRRSGESRDWLLLVIPAKAGIPLDL